MVKSLLQQFPSSNNNFAKFPIRKSHDRNSEMRNNHCLQTYHEDSTNYLLSTTKTTQNVQISSHHTLMLESSLESTVRLQLVKSVTCSDVVYIYNEI